MITKSLSPLVAALDLKPHPEGGWYKELWKASFEIPKEVLNEAYTGSRYAATSIYFVLHPEEFSEWHTVLSDELWLWHSGSPLLLTLGGTKDKPEETQEIILGPDVINGQCLSTSLSSGQRLADGKTARNRACFCLLCCSAGVSL